MQSSSGLSPQPGLQRSQVKGLYMYGGVGCGKTMLMDLFVRAAPREFQVGGGGVGRGRGQGGEEGWQGGWRWGWRRGKVGWMGVDEGGKGGGKGGEGGQGEGAKGVDGGYACLFEKGESG